MKCFEPLLSSGADPKQNPKGLIYWAVKGGNLSCVSKLLDLQVLGTEEIDLCELIYKDALGDNVEMLQLLLKYFPTSVFQTVRRQLFRIYV
jgi:hypothetical protein